jgi:quinol monooxygenase YgiN
LIIVTGSYHVPVDERDRFMSSKLEQTAATRGEVGCLEYAYSADAGQPDLVRLIELWESMADLEAHVRRLRSDPPEGPGVEVISSTFAVFEGAPARMPGV